MTEASVEKMQDLEAKLKVLEEENILLSDRAEETLLLRLIAETISFEENQHTLLDAVLEKVSILKDISFCACCRQEDTNLLPLHIYTSFKPADDQQCQISIPSSLSQDLDHGSFLFSIDDFPIFFCNRAYNPKHVMLYPFSTTRIPNGVFLFADEDDDKSRFSNMTLLIQHIVDMVVEKLDKIALLDEIKKMNHLLEERVAERTKELDELNKQLKTSEEKYRELFNKANDAIYLWEITNEGLPGACIEVNDIACQMLGYSRDELVGTTPNHIDTMENVDVLPAVMQSLLEHGAARFETLNVTKSGEIIPVEVNAHKFILHDRPVILSVTRDIRERKLAEEEKHQLQSKLAQSQKMEAIGTLTGGISHDFNNLLTVINGNSEMALLRTGKEHRAHANIKAILDAGKKAADMTSKLLAFSRKQVHERKIIDLNKQIAETEGLIRRLISEDIALEFELESQPRFIKADRAQIEQIIMNLAINARDAIQSINNPSHRRITISTGSFTIDQNHIDEHPNSIQGEHVLISVQDTGIGMSEEVRERIFEPFFTTKDIGSGTGLGLSTVYGIVKQNNASIEVKTRPGVGSTFTVYWPLVENAQSENTSSIKEKTHSIGNETILFVEDDDLVREFAGEVLLTSGYTVIEATNGKEALDIASTTDMPFDLVITDLIMPEMNGQELATALADKIPLSRFLFISGYANDHLIQNGLLRPDINYIQKPFTIPMLTNKVREILDSLPEQ